MSPFRPWLRLLPLALLAAAGVCVAASSGTPDDRLARIQAKRQLRVAVPQSWYPFAVVDAQGAVGYDVSMARIVARDLGVSLVLVPVPARTPASQIDLSVVDLVMTGEPYTPEVDHTLAFSIPYAPTYMGVFARKGWSPNASGEPSSLGVARGNPQRAAIERGMPEAFVVNFDSDEAALRALQSGEVDQVAVPNDVVEAVRGVRRDRIELKARLDDLPHCVGVPKGEKRLLDRVNATVREAARNGALMVNALLWFKTTAPAFQPPPQ